MKTKNIILIITAITGSIMIIMGLSHEMRRPKVSKYMTNDEIIAESKKCMEAGLYPAQNNTNFYNRTSEVICRPIKN